MSSTKRRGRGQRSSWSSSRAGSRGRASTPGLGAAGKFTFARRVCAAGKFPPSPQGQVGFWLKQSSLHRARSPVCLQRLDLQVPACHSCQALAGAGARGPDPLPFTWSFCQNSLSSHPAFRSVTQLGGKDCASLAGCPSLHVEGSTAQTWENGEPGVQISEAQIPAWEVVPWALPSYQETQLPLLR